MPLTDADAKSILEPLYAGTRDADDSPMTAAITVATACQRLPPRGSTTTTLADDKHGPEFAKISRFLRGERIAPFRDEWGGVDIVDMLALLDHELAETWTWTQGKDWRIDGLLRPTPNDKLRGLLPAVLANVTFPLGGPWSDPSRSYSLQRTMANYKARKGTARPVLAAVGVSDEVFLGLIAQGTHFKDLGANVIHGAYTHQIQWWCIEKSGILYDPWSTFCQVAAYGPNPDLKQTGAEAGTYLWDALFDRQYTSDPLPKGTHPYRTRGQRSGDFRSPLELNRTLLDSSEKFSFTHQRALEIRRRCPTLSLCVTRSYQTANIPFYSGIQPHFATLNYVSRALYGRGYSQLDKQETGVVDKRAKGVFYLRELSPRG